MPDYIIGLDSGSASASGVLINAATGHEVASNDHDYRHDQLGRVGGFSLHAGVSVNTCERKKLERICRGGLPPLISLLRRNNVASLRIGHLGCRGKSGVHCFLVSRFL